MKTIVEFRSSAFPSYEGEINETNPGKYGKRLAEFLARGLQEKGFQPKELKAEDWGWIIPIQNDVFPLWIGCGNSDEYPDGFMCFIEPHEPMIRKFLFFGKIDTTARVSTLQQAIDELLSANPSVIDKKWWSYKEFNSPVR